jgi:hypothetical protein
MPPIREHPRLTDAGKKAHCDEVAWMHEHGKLRPAKPPKTKRGHDWVQDAESDAPSGPWPLS